jgi:drug/metabolite transporter (DMT)-like permease
MGLLGVGLGLLVAFLWGGADIFAALATRLLSTFETTIISQLTSFLTLLLICDGLLWWSNFSVTLPGLLDSAALGVFTGLCATLAYLAFYHALELGPVAITGPLTATSPIITLLLSTFLLRERLTAEQIGLVIAAMVGVVLATTNLSELRMLLTKSRFSLWTQGVRWAIVATLAFGSLDFGIGASASFSNWLIPGLCTRFFTLFFLCIFAYGARLWNKLRISSPTHTAPTNTFFRSPFGFRGLYAFLSVTPTISWKGFCLALVIGIIESAAILVFTLDTRIATTGITSAIASSYGLFVLLLGVFVYRERLTINQIFGILLFMVSVALLALV